MMEEKIVKKLGLRSDTAYVLAVARLIKEDLKALEIKHMFCGSIRRGLSPHDIDLVICTSMGKASSLTQDWQNITELVYPPYEDDGSFHCHCYMYKNVKVDLLPVLTSQFGFATLFLTGDRYFGECLKEQAMQRRLKLTPYGFVDPYFGHPLDEVNGFYKGLTEEEIFHRLGVPYVPPAQRETYL